MAGHCERNYRVLGFEKLRGNSRNQAIAIGVRDQNALSFMVDDDLKHSWIS